MSYTVAIQIAAKLLSKFLLANALNVFGPGRDNRFWDKNLQLEARHNRNWSFKGDQVVSLVTNPRGVG